MDRKYGGVERCRKATEKEIMVAYSSFGDIIEKIAHTNANDSRKLITSARFPFLNNDAIDTICSFYESKGYYPVFKLLCLYFENTTDRNEVIWNNYYGITVSSTSLTEIANRFNLTRERVRQIVANYEPSDIVSVLLNNMNEKYYTFLKDDYIIPGLVAEHIYEREFDSTGYFSYGAVLAIVSLLPNFSTIKYCDKEFLIRKDLIDTFDFCMSFADITRTLSAKTSEDVYLPIDYFITNYILDSSVNIGRIRNVVASIMEYVVGIKLDDKNNIKIERNVVDVEKEIYSIIETNGAPMSFVDIKSQFERLYPENSYAEGTFRTFIMNSDRILPIGKTSTYTIDKWNVSRLTIRDIIRNILEESERPLTLGEIVEFLNLKGYDTNVNSVNSSIMRDEKVAYTKFKGGFVGLQDKDYDSIYIPLNKDLIARKTFEERITDYLNFIDTNLHVPFSSGDDQETSLYRWYKNVLSGAVSATPEQLSTLNEELKKRDEYVMTSDEYAFIEKCKDFKFYVSTEFELPNNRTNNSLYNWLAKIKPNVGKLEGKKKKAFDEMVSFIADYGFYIN